jgi:hypothetical protein
VGADAVAGDAEGGVGGALREPLMPMTRKPLLTRGDVIFVTIVTAGVATPLLALTQKPSGWMLAVDAILSALLGLLVAAVVASVVRFFERSRGPAGSIEVAKVQRSQGDARGIVLATIIGLAGLACGYYVDRWLGTTPWLSLGALCFAMIVGFWSMSGR